MSHSSFFGLEKINEAWRVLVEGFIEVAFKILVGDAIKLSKDLEDREDIARGIATLSCPSFN